MTAPFFAGGSCPYRVVACHREQVDILIVKDSILKENNTMYELRGPYKNTVAYKDKNRVPTIWADTKE